MHSINDKIDNSGTMTIGISGTITTIDNKGIDAFNQLVENNKQNIFNRAGMNPRYNVV